MDRFLLGLFILLHGLVHFWYVVLSQQWVAFQADMGWTGQSWLLTGVLAESPIRWLASGLFGLSAVIFAAGAIGVFVQGDWWRPVTLGAAVLSTISVLLFWDGSWQLIVQKGLLGLLIDAGLIIALLASW